MLGRGSDYFLKSLSSNLDYSPLIAQHTFGGFILLKLNSYLGVPFLMWQIILFFLQKSITFCAFCL